MNFTVRDNIMVRQMMNQIGGRQMQEIQGDDILFETKTQVRTSEGEKKYRKMKSRGQKKIRRERIRKRIEKDKMQRLVNERIKNKKAKQMKKQNH